MTRKEHPEEQPAPERRFPPERVRQFLFDMRNLLALTEGGPQKFEDLEAFTGRSTSTIGSWYEGAPMHQVEFAISLLERLPEEARHQLIDRTCRPHPSILHPNLAHDPLTVARLERIIEQPYGLTILRGQESVRAFTFAAIANSVQHVRRGKALVCGVEMQLMPWASPRGVINTHYCHQPEQLRRRISEIISAPDGSVVLLGEHWWKLKELTTEVGPLSRRCNVIATDAPIFASIHTIRPRPGNVQILNVTRVREKPEWLEITVSS